MAIRTYKCSPGHPAAIDIPGELEGMEFINFAPIEYRLMRGSDPVSEWTAGALGFIDFQHTNIEGSRLITRGMLGLGLTVEIGGLVGDCTLLVWERH